MHCIKIENQQDATIRCLLLTSVSTCFGHHYAHLQENKGPSYGIWCVVLVLLDVVGSGCGVLRCRMRVVLVLLDVVGSGCGALRCRMRALLDVYYQLLSQHVSGIIMPIFRRTKTL